MDAGYHSVVWDANSYASRVYFVKMVAGVYPYTKADASEIKLKDKRL